MDYDDIETADENPQDYQVLALVEAEQDSSKTGPKPKKPVAIEVEGFEVGRGVRRRVVFPNEIYKLAAIGLTDRDIARWVHVDENTLRYNFSEILAKGREEIKISLRRAQLKLALSGNAVMLIWLGKNILGQTDAPGQTIDNPILPWSDDE